jgi:hypothetical protein
MTNKYLLTVLKTMLQIDDMEILKYTIESLIEQIKEEKYKGNDETKIPTPRRN